MKKNAISFVLCVLICWSFSYADSLESLYQKLPQDTFGFVATSGTNNFQADFQNSIMGQIAADPQVKTFFEQIFTSVSKSPNFEGAFGQGEDYIAFVKGLLASPTVLAMAATSDNLSDEPCGILLAERITSDSDLGISLAKMIAAQIGSGKIIEKQISGHRAYVSNDPNTCEIYYIAPMDDCFLTVFNDKQYTVLQRIASNAANYEITNKLSEVASSSDAFVIFADMQKFMAVINEEAATDPDAQQALGAFRSLGLTDMQYYILRVDFSDKNLVIDGKMKVPVSTGIWNAVASVDKSQFDLADSKAMQASAVHINPIELYDSIMGCVSQIAKSEGHPVEPQIAQFEETLGFKLRDDLLTSLDGSMMGYMLPAYSSPELLTGGYVVTARLKNAETFQKCMLSLETFVKSTAPADQLQITSQKDADGNEIHIWAVGLMAMMQVIPSWAIEGDTLIIASHPNITKKIMERIAAGTGESLVSKAEFANAMSRIPDDAFAMSLTDSKAQARQFMKMLQQYWPMLNMGLMQEGIQLPIMLPSIEPYIEKMQPGLSYARKSYDGIEFHYEGSGLEATSGGVAGGAMGAAILMPALSKTKKISQRVVSGTNLKGIGTACVVYANDYDGKYPSDFQVLVDECDVSPDSLVSPRKPASFDGPSYILIQGLTDAAPASIVLAYENPVFCEDNMVNILYCDGHVSADSKDQLKLDLQKTYEYLQKPVPDMNW